MNGGPTFVRLTVAGLVQVSNTRSNSAGCTEYSSPYFFCSPLHVSAYPPAHNSFCERLTLKS